MDAEQRRNSCRDSTDLFRFNLETAVGCEKDVQACYVFGKFEKFVVTPLVMRSFSNSADASRACTDFHNPTAVSRFKGASNSTNIIKPCHD